MSYRLINSVFKVLVVSFLSLGVSAKVQALNQPQKSLYDGRIRTITYNPDDVVQLDTLAGITTHMMLEPGETYITHAFGDSEAYAFAVNQHHLFLKPKAEQAPAAAAFDVTAATAAEAEVRDAAESVKAQVTAAAMEAATTLAADDTAGDPAKGRAAWDAVAG